MFKPCSKGCQYTLRVLAFVFAERMQGSFRAKEVCEQVGVPESFTRKILQTLVRNGLLETRRGPKGGYTVVGSPRDLTFLDVIKSVDGEDTFDECILGASEHNESNPCPFHESWMKVRAGLLEYLGQTHLARD
ncbi:MAG: Rrf2 family transcriptional regulator [Candidatus Hydrogenedentes bacterium]|nr:Rrf2 family transcriptional regulator [Candidatus Hydrogenedentota bacterium]